MRRNAFTNLLISNGWNLADAEMEWDMASTDPDNFDPPETDDEAG